MLVARILGPVALVLGAGAIVGGAVLLDHQSEPAAGAALIMLGIVLLLAGMVVTGLGRQRGKASACAPGPAGGVPTMVAPPGYFPPAVVPPQAVPPPPPTPSRRRKDRGWVDAVMDLLNILP